MKMKITGTERKNAPNMFENLQNVASFAQLQFKAMNISIF